MRLDSYRWPAEWEPHAGTWLAWPVNPDTWPGLFENIPKAYARFVAAVAQFEPVFLLANSAVQPEAARLVESACSATAACHPVHFFDVATNDSWCRDFGPQFLQHSTPGHGSGPAQLIVDWGYNAWGQKYPPWNLDAAATQQIAKLTSLDVVTPGLVLEGGAIDGNGKGTVMTTASCLLHPGRNGTVERSTVESWLNVWMGAKQVIWLPGGGIAGDDTDGHIDQIARFVGLRSVVVATPADNDSAHADALRENLRVLSEARIDQQSLQLTELQCPCPAFHNGHPLPCSYANFYLCNSGVLCPLFQDPADDEAMAVLQAVFPDRRVVGVDCLDLVWGLGALHCLTREQPLAPSS